MSFSQQPFLPLGLDEASAPSSPVVDRRPAEPTQLTEAAEAAQAQLRVPPQPPSPPARAAEERLWLCLFLPCLPLEVIRRRGEAPLALLGEESRKPLIVMCDERAARCGVRPGMSVTAALALAPQLELQPPERGLEQDALAQLAHWAARFTPVVSIEAGNALLLEVAASLPLFDGLSALRDLALRGVGARGHRVRSAVAPTARAALWLARAGEEEIVTEPARLQGVLARLPVSIAGWPKAVREQLGRMGIERLGECWRLPRDGLARRVGQACLAELDEALGKRPELRTAVPPDTRFCDALELPAETRDTQLLLTGLRILLQRLHAHLLVHQAGTQALELSLRHRYAQVTVLRIGLLRPSMSARHLESLAAIHLDAAAVPAPVLALGLEAELVAGVPVRGADLLGRCASDGERLGGLVERLRMRLGPRAVHGIALSPAHRPEQAWRALQDPLALRPREAQLTAGMRPTWLLEQPLPLSSRAGLPLLDGPLTLARGPERIETGWWDGGDVRRDYYVAHTTRGERLWIFKDLRQASWHLHGRFG